MIKKLLFLIIIFITFNVFAINYNNYVGYWYSGDMILIISKENNKYYYKYYGMDFEYDKTIQTDPLEQNYIEMLDDDNFRIIEYPKQELKTLNNKIKYKTEYGEYSARSSLEFKDKDARSFVIPGDEYLAAYDEKGKRYPAEDLYRMNKNLLETFSKIKVKKANY